MPADGQGKWRVTFPPLTKGRIKEGLADFLFLFSPFTKGEIKRGFADYF